jgi:hypothetical protein
MSCHGEFANVGTRADPYVVSRSRKATTGGSGSFGRTERRFGDSCISSTYCFYVEREAENSWKICRKHCVCRKA